jgi:hypothetical protein
MLDFLHVYFSRWDLIRGQKRCSSGGSVVATVSAPDQPDAADSVGTLSEFTSPDLESHFRRQHFEGELLPAQACVLAGVLATVLFIPNDIAVLVDPARLGAILGMRAVIVVAGLLTFATLRQQTGPARFERLLVGWCVLFSSFSVLVAFMRPLPFMGSAFRFALLVLIIYCVVPLSLRRQLIPVGILTLGGLALCARGFPVAESTAALAVIVSLIVANLLGAATSWRLNRSKRWLFAHARREAHLRGGLEKALAEIRTLRGLHAVCCYCKKLRDETGRWETMEVYLRDRTHADFSHGICPQCLASVLPTHAAEKGPVADEDEMLN